MNPEEQQQVVGEENKIFNLTGEVGKKIINEEDFPVLEEVFTEIFGKFEEPKFDLHHGRYYYDLSQIDSYVEKLNKKIQQHEGEITKNQGEITNIQGEITKIQNVINILNRENINYQTNDWYNFISDYCTEKYETQESCLNTTKLNKATDVQKKELCAYYKADPSILNKLSLKLFENADDIEIIKISEGGREITDKLSINIPDGYKKRGPFIVLNSEAGLYDIELLNWVNIKDENIKKIEDIDIYEKIKDIEDIYVIMLGDGGVISGKGKDAIWDNVSDNQNKYSLRFRYAGWTDTNRLLQNSNKILDVFQQSNKNFGKEFVYTMTHGGKTRKRSKRQSKSKTQRRRKSKSKTQRRRKSTLKKSAKSKRRYRK
jgi:hypothetical protein